MSRWWQISINSEILIMTLIGLSTTVMEGIYMNLRDNIKEIWMLTFSEDFLPNSIENLIKTVMSCIVIARGATVHVSLASYLLIIYTIITERLRTMLVLWMAIAAIRTIIINLVATIVGCVLCASYPQIRPVCFEFAIIKAVELACSVFMWVNINDFYYHLKGKQRHILADTNELVENKNSMVKSADSEDSFDLSSLTISKSFLENTSLNDENKESSSLNSLVAKTAVRWFITKATGVNTKEKFLLDDKKATDMFLAMSVDDIVKLQEWMRKFNEENRQDNSNTNVYEQKDIITDGCNIERNVRNHNIEHTIPDHDVIEHTTSNHKDKALELVSEILSDSLNVAMSKVGNFGTSKMTRKKNELEGEQHETNTGSSSTILCNNVLMKQSLPKPNSNNLLGEIDQTTIVRAIYERKNPNFPAPNIPNKKKLLLIMNNKNNLKNNN